ncbi:MAG: DUF2955 domain-containing protein [Proteobacteria bacterium]|nr:DUF2955 domain-containing protein [Pseudomonadota bacterium]MBU1457032.1 DUF2955 domain-containing protein [Pseudomonadota bacterium]
MKNRTAVDSRRILRLALGTALAIAFSQAVNWPISFVTPIIAGLLLSLPLPAPSLKMTLIVMGALAGTLLFSFLLLPYLYHARAAGVVLVSLALFGSFYVTAAGGSALIGTLLTLALTLLTTICSASIDAFLDLTKGLIWSALMGIVFAWVAHALLPNHTMPSLPAGDGEKPKPARPESHEAVRSAFRSVVIVFPVMLLFLFLSTSSAYTVIMIKIATTGQQATSIKGRELSREFLASTFWGGAGGSCCLAGNESVSIPGALQPSHCSGYDYLRQGYFQSGSHASQGGNVAICIHHNDHCARTNCRINGIRPECV